MRELTGLLTARVRAIRHAALEFLRGSRLRILVVCGLVGFFWLLTFGLFLDAFLFVRENFQAISGMLMDYLFAFFFVALLAMMGISNTIIAYTSLFRSEETEFLLSMPLHAPNAFLFRGADSAVFGVWGMVSLVLPLIVAYGIVFPVPLYFFPLAAALAALFLVFVVEAGAVLALAVGIGIQRHKKLLVGLLGCAAALALVLWLRPLWRQRPENLFTEATLKRVMDRIAFCQHWALPSHWVSEGMLSAARGSPGRSGFLLLLLLANVLFLGMFGHWLAGYVYIPVWEAVQGASSRKRRSAAGFRSRVGRMLLFFLPFRLRQLVRKDVRTFLRDPAQWSQFVLFFGLLGLYVLNLPHFGVEALEPYWHSLISLLNLGATCLTLATLTSRFVFPQLSLEGRRIWITGLLPMRRSLILWGKFAFAAVGTFLISGGLIALSDILIGLPPLVLAVHMGVVLCVCCGLNGLAVGLGALYPRLGTDSPARIVSSFGGTLNLICSIVFIVFAIAPVVLPLHFFVLGRWTGARLYARLGIGLGIVVLISAVACLVPMLAGARAFEKMEF